MPRVALQHMGPEEFLLRALEEKGFRIGIFPALALLDCCDPGTSSRCFSNLCHGIWCAAAAAAALPAFLCMRDHS